MFIFDMMKFIAALAGFSVTVLFPLYVVFKIYFRLKLKRMGIPRLFSFTMIFYFVVLVCPIFIVPRFLKFKVKTISA